MNDNTVPTRLQGILLCFHSMIIHFSIKSVFAGLEHIQSTIESLGFINKYKKQCGHYIIFGAVAGSVGYFNWGVPRCFRIVSDVIQS